MHRPRHVASRAPAPHVWWAPTAPRLPASPPTLHLPVAPLACRREAFDLFDTDGSGQIDAKELKVAMR